MPKITAIVLAAGLSRRMGDENKLFLEYKGKPIVDHVISELKRSSVDNLVIVGSELSLKNLEKHKNSNSIVVENKDYRTGMTSSIKAGVKAAGKTEGFMICLGDQPLIDANTYDQVVAEFRENYAKDSTLIVVPFFESEKGNPVIFSSEYTKEILRNPEPEGCKNIVKAHSENVLRVEVDNSGILADIDTTEDYKSLNK